MVFSSYEFVFIFLPLTFMATVLARRFFGLRVAMAVLALASLIFYGYWKASYIFIILGSIAANFVISRAIIRYRGTRGAYVLTLLGVVGNLLALGWYKYADFVAINLAAFGVDITPLGILLPIGISFFTFQQIAYLVDVYRGEAEEYSFRDYALFISFFPQLIAGPIVHHSQLAPQFAKTRFLALESRDLAAGAAFMTFGLFKKLVIADSLALYADPVFAAADAGMAVSTLEGWLAALSYTFQLYFDFSGYSDMAIGLGYFFGVTLPANFMSPYQSRNIAEFWRRWHITLSHFLRDYLYIPLGGNRFGFPRQLINLMVTMLLGGLWHGAGWNFVIWGGLHGLYLCVHQLWSRARAGVKAAPGLVGRAFGWLVTFIAVVIAWVPFRATTGEGAMAFWSAMLTRLEMPQPLAGRVGPAGPLVESLGGTFSAPLHVALRDWTTGVPLIAVAALIAFLAPNSNRLIPARIARMDGETRITAPSLLGTVALAMMFTAAILFIGRKSVFLYFQF